VTVTEDRPADIADVPADRFFEELAAGAEESSLPPAYHGAVTPNPTVDGGPVEDVTLPSSTPEPTKPLSAKERVKRAARRATGVPPETSPGGSPVTEDMKGAARTKPSAGTSSVSPPRLREGHFVKPLTQLYTTIGLTLMPFDQACATAFVANAESCAKAMDALARENDAVRKALLALTQTSAWGGVLLAHAPIILMIATHHGPEPMKDKIAPLAMMMNGKAFAPSEEAKAA
jgi:hypothetical protein